MSQQNDRSSNPRVGVALTKRTQSVATAATSTAKSERRYRLVFVNDGCTDYFVDDVVVVMVQEPPPPWTAIDMGGNCSDLVGVLEDE